MNLIDKIALVGQRMKSEQISLKESLMASSRVSVSDDSVEGVDRLMPSVIHAIETTIIAALSLLRTTKGGRVKARVLWPWLLQLRLTSS